MGEERVRGWTEERGQVRVALEEGTSLPCAMLTKNIGPSGLCKTLKNIISLLKAYAVTCRAEMGVKYSSSPNI